MKHHKIFSPQFTALVLIVCFAMLICGFNHDGPMFHSAELSGATGHSNAIAFGCNGVVCLTLGSKATVLPDKFLGVFLFLILLASSRFFTDGRNPQGFSSAFRRLSLNSHLGSNKRYRDISVYRL